MSANHVLKQAPTRNKARGFALVIMLAILIAGSLYFVVRNLDKVAMTSEQTTNTGLALQAAKDALLNYAATYPDNNANQVFGYLPCPDMDGDGIADPSSSCQTAQDVTVVGLLPFKTLGLTDLRDSAGNCLWYAVSGHFKASLSNKTDTLNWDTQGQLIVKNIQGTTITQPEDAQGGAAAVIFAVGPPLNGQTRVATNTLCQVTPSTIDHTHFIDSDSVTPGAAPSSKAANDPTSLSMGDASSSTNNDMLAWVSPLDVFTRVKARKGGTTNDFVGRIRTLNNNIANKLTATSGGPLPAPIAPTTIGSLTYGTLPSLSFSNQQLANDLQNWQGQYRYAKCTTNTQCINTTTVSCAGVLLFAGERTARGPRTAAEVAHPSLSSFFENVGTSLNLSNLTAGGTSFTSVYGANGLSSNGSTLTSSAFSITAAANAASGDDIICLNPTPTPPFSITGFGAFQNTQTPSATVAAISTPSLGSTQLTLGSLVTLSDLYGCSWHANAINLSTGMRAYFRFNIQDQGAGFTFTVADSSTNTSTNMCGKTGGALGYSGDNGATAPIKSPKLALEFDTNNDGAARNDPVAHHAALVFWAGATRTADQDNIHGMCATDVTPNQPCNPNTTPGIKEINSNLNWSYGDVYVRIDLVPNAGTTPTTYALKAYITKDIIERSYCELDTLAKDVVDLVNDPASPCNMSPTLSGSLQTTMSSAYLGFTVGQNAGSSGDQKIVVDKFQAKGR